MATLAHPKYTLVAKEEAEGFAWSFEGPNQEPKLYPFKFPPIQPHEIRIQQSYFGLCYTDCKTLPLYAYARSHCQSRVVPHSVPRRTRPRNHRACSSKRRPGYQIPTGRVGWCRIHSKFMWHLQVLYYWERPALRR